MLGNGTDALLQEQEYPTSTADLIATIGEETIAHPNGAETVGDVLSRLEGETYGSAEEALAALYCGVSRDAIGRYRYSDRDSPPLGSTDVPEQLSF